MSGHAIPSIAAVRAKAKRTLGKALDATDEAALREENTEPKSPFVVGSVSNEWLTSVPPAREYLLTDVRTGSGALAARGVTLFVSAGGVGKSYATIWLALAVATGQTNWLGVMKAKPGRVLLISAEDDIPEIRRRVFYAAKAVGIREVEPDAIEILDVSAQHLHLLDSNAMRTGSAESLLAHVKERGPFALVVVDPLGRVAGAPIDADNAVAGALLSFLAELGGVAQGAVLAPHHTDKAARRDNIRDASAVRGATGLGDYARAIIVAAAEKRPSVDPQLAEIVAVSMAKSNYTRKWEPVELRRGEHGELIPLDDIDREMLRASVPLTKSERTARERAERAANETAKKAEKEAAAEAARRERDETDDEAARTLVSEHPNATTRDLVARLTKRLACGGNRAHAALARVRSS